MRRVNWSQAVAEVVLLLGGAALALGVDSCQGAAEDAAVEHAYLTSLRRDFEEASATLEQREALVAEQLEHNQAFLEILAGPVGAVGVDSLSLLVRPAFVMRLSQPEIVTYRDLVSSGNLGVLTSELLRASLVRYDLSLNEVEAITAVSMDQWASLQSSYFIANLNTTTVYGRESLSAVTAADSSWVLAHTPIVAHISTDPGAFWSREFVNLLAIRNLTLSDEIRLVRVSLELAREISRQLEDLLDARSKGR